MLQDASSLPKREVGSQTTGNTLSVGVIVKTVLWHFSIYWVWLKVQFSIECNNDHNQFQLDLPCLCSTDSDRTGSSRGNSSISSSSNSSSRS